MMGFVWLAAIGAVAFAGLWLTGLASNLRLMGAAALMLGATGYAWQGRPSLGGTAARPNAEAGEVEPAMIDLRDRLLGRYTADTAFLVASDAMVRSGDFDAASRVLLAGTRKYPRSFILWTGLGTAMAQRDGNQVSPAALLAFQQAARLAPEHPAPPFYLGLAYVRAGEYDRGRALWRRAIALSPEGASYRQDMTILLMLMDRGLAEGQGAPK